MSTIQVKKMQVANMKLIEESLGTDYDDKEEEEEDEDEYYDIKDENEQLANEAILNGDKETFYRLQAIMVERLNYTSYFKPVVRQSILDIYFIDYDGRRGNRQYFGKRYL
jgi:hypothetical protein